MATQKEQVWITEYKKCWNATEAARRAGYKWPDRQGQEKKAKFAAEIKAFLDEKIMSADEALLLLSDQARADISDFLKFYDGVKDPFIDLSSAKDKGVLHLVKKIKYNDKGQPEIELYDAQAALRDILKIHGKFKDVAFNFDLSQCTNEQLQRIANGEDPLAVIAGASAS